MLSQINHKFMKYKIITLALALACYTISAASFNFLGSQDVTNIATPIVTNAITTAGVGLTNGLITGYLITNGNGDMYYGHYPTPVVDFTAEYTNGTAPFEANFNSSVSNATSVEWDFGTGHEFSSELNL